MFKLHSEYKPTGDQPQAIESLVEGFKAGNQFQTLLGVIMVSILYPALKGIRILNPELSDK